MNFYECKPDIRKHLNDNDMRFLDELAHFAGKYHADNIHSRIGYEVLGPALLGYSSWLHSEAVKSGAEMIVFLAREGNILKRAYETLLGQNALKTVYINVSRVSLCRASVVYAKDLDDILYLFTHNLVNGRTKIQELFGLLGIPECADEYHNSGRNISDIEDRHELYDFIMRRRMAYFYKQNILLKKYLADKGITGGKVILSDIGYAGTMQSLLSVITPCVRYSGCYIIGSDKSRYRHTLIFSKPEVSGYWNSNKADWEDTGHYFSSAVLKFETLFLSAEGTTTAYAENTSWGGGCRAY